MTRRRLSWKSCCYCSMKRWKNCCLPHWPEDLFLPHYPPRSPRVRTNQKRDLRSNPSMSDGETACAGHFRGHEKAHSLLEVGTYGRDLGLKSRGSERWRFDAEQKGLLARPALLRNCEIICRNKGTEPLPRCDSEFVMIRFHIGGHLAQLS